ncbi:polysaccharide deacetylase family protein [Streptomyces sp. NPDC046821]|uniref:polysaccharide deacetylase family protein n=1 Tax=Streptomyces sp. NPDC046821 TaxID=3154702 RepID=UPI0033EA35BF
MTLTSVRAHQARTRSGPRRLLATALAAGVLSSALLTGCAQSVSPIERLGRRAAQAAQKVRHGHEAPTVLPAGGVGSAGERGRGKSPGSPGGGSASATVLKAPAHHSKSRRLLHHRTNGSAHVGAGDPAHTGAHAPDTAPVAPLKVPARDAYRHWGLRAPLAAAPEPPAHPASRAARNAYALPPVVDHVRTRDRVVFLTFDDGAAGDPRLAGLVRDLRLPVTVFLTDRVAGPGRDHAGALRRLGAGVQNQTINGHFLPALPYAEQHAEICVQQDRLAGRFGSSPRLLRPPFGNYGQDTLRAAATCGVDAVVLWRAERNGDRLRPGDIVLAQAPGGATLADATARMVRRIQDEGFTVGRLEDYV